MNEKYEPSEEEINKAEDIMTEDEKDDSEEREETEKFKAVQKEKEKEFQKFVAENKKNEETLRDALKEKEINLSYHELNGVLDSMPGPLESALEWIKLLKKEDVEKAVGLIYKWHRYNNRGMNKMPSDIFVVFEAEKELGIFLYEKIEEALKAQMAESEK